MAASRNLLIALLLTACFSIAAPARADVPPQPRAPLTDAVRNAALANNQFTFDIFREVSASKSPGDNLLISPFSVTTALAMTYAGARGQTADQMADVFHWTGAPEQTHEGYGGWLADLNAPRQVGDLTAVNRLFAQEGYPFRQSYLDLVAGVYDAPVEQLDFVNEPEPSRVHINDWVADNTNNLIKDLLPGGSVTPNTRLVLTNAVYFNGDWKHQFKEQHTSAQPFRLVDGTTRATPMMYQEEKFAYGEFAAYKMIELPYEGDDLSMVIVLPNAPDGLAAVEQSLTAETFAANVVSLHEREVELHLPKFKFKDEATLGSALSSLGMPLAFSDAADFSGMADANLMISEVFHKSFISVDEQGTEAAAATGVIMVPTSVIIPVDFRADHAFLFAIRDRHTGGILFWGRMTDPVAATEAADTAVPEPSSAVGALIAALVLARGGRAVRAVRQDKSRLHGG
jgi:serpin B